TAAWTSTDGSNEHEGATRTRRNGRTPAPIDLWTLVELALLELRAEQSTSKRKYEPGNDGLRYIESFLMNML
ncbi:hypothetical protein PC123_g22640, partial [Phytophthora cactorum]